jgi:exodeoxyribonuclease VII large subunit
VLKSNSAHSFAIDGSGRLMNTRTERKVLSVTEITSRIKGLLEGEFPSVWVEGEISNFKRAASGHLYFTLKDESAQLRCVCFKSSARSIRFNLEDGLKIVVRGSLSIYERRGEYQLYVEVAEPSGIGALQLAFEQLKVKLQAEGLFDASRKRPLPLYPQSIGVVTSPTGAAIRDILRVLKRRHKGISVMIYPAKVQGEGAAAEIVDGIRYFSEAQNADVVIIGRGGGSVEDLWAFNEEIVARAIAASKVPIISAVGHEIDFTISDFVADLRAPTPSAAAEIVSTAKDDISRQVTRLSEQLRSSLALTLHRCRRHLLELTGSRGFSLARNTLQQFRQAFDELTYKLTGSEQHFLSEQRNHHLLLRNRLIYFDLNKQLRVNRLTVERLANQTRAEFQRRLASARQTLMILNGKMESLSPLRVLERGYSIVKTSTGAIVKEAAQARPGDLISVQLFQGELTARVTGSGAVQSSGPIGNQSILKFEES